jgi:hypothetical protein
MRGGGATYRVQSAYRDADGFAERILRRLSPEKAARDQPRIAGASCSCRARDRVRVMRTFAEFWPFYLREHSRPATRALHFVGTTLSLLLIVSAIAARRPTLLLAALLCGYAFAWVAHFFVEHNKPATFKYPLWSFAADWRMWALTLRGRLGPELQRALRPRGE